MKAEFPPFPNSKIDPFLITSPDTPFYNCIAWAYGDNTKWYWPDSSNIYFWPDDIPREEKLEYFILLFEKIGFNICNTGELDNKFDKVAIYCNQLGKPTHAARQLENGFWTSKLGQHFDVTHTVFSMSNGAYGNITIYMSRKK